MLISGSTHHAFPPGPAVSPQALCTHTHWGGLFCQDVGSPLRTNDSQTVSSTFTLLSCRPVSSPTLQIGLCTRPQLFQTQLNELHLSLPFRPSPHLFFHWNAPPSAQEWKAKTQTSCWSFSFPGLPALAGEQTLVWFSSASLKSILLSHIFFSNTLAFTSRVMVELSVSSHFFQFVLFPTAVWAPN